MNRLKKTVLGLPGQVIVLLALSISALPALAYELYACNGGAVRGADDGGAIMTIEQSTGAGTVIGIPFPGRGLPGCAFDANGHLFAVTSATGFADYSAFLIEIDPQTGALINNVGQLLLGATEVLINDISFQPQTGVLFGSVSFDENNLGWNDLVTIDLNTGSLTLIGTPDYVTDGSADGFVSIAFASDGTLYAKEGNGGELWTLNPGNANVLSTTVINPDIGTLGLGIHPANDWLMLSECCDTTLGNAIFRLHPLIGTADYLGPAGGDRAVHDFAFHPFPTSPVPGLSFRASMLLVLALLALAVSGRRFIRVQR